MAHFYLYVWVLLVVTIRCRVNMEYVSGDTVYMDPCNGIQKSAYGRIISHASRETGAPYSSYINCIATISVEPGKRIYLYPEHDQVLLRSSDYMKIYDGSSTSAYLAVSVSSAGIYRDAYFKSTSNTITIHFRTYAYSYYAYADGRGFTLYYTAFTPHCSNDRFSCLLDNICIDEEQVCDSHPACRDQSDESDCYGFIDEAIIIVIVVLVIVIVVCIIIVVVCCVRKRRNRRILQIHVAPAPPSAMHPPPSPIPLATYPTQGMQPQALPPYPTGSPLPPPPVSPAGLPMPQPEIITTPASPVPPPPAPTLYVA